VVTAHVDSQRAFEACGMLGAASHIFCAEKQAQLIDGIVGEMQLEYPH
jgi:hypothetical protein